MEALQILWFILVLVLFMGYSFLDGFDLGIGALFPMLGKTKEEKDSLIGAIAPVWDGNEVWLITAGGALFAAFPHAYATAFSGFYIAMMLVLFSLIFRAVSMEFRAHDSKRKKFWEGAFTAGSFLAALLFGVALGNVVWGVPLEKNMEYAGGFFTLLKPVPLLFGLTGLSAVFMQGLTYTIKKTEDALQERAFNFSRRIFFIYLGLVVILAAVLGTRGASNPVYWAGIIAAVAGFALLRGGIWNRAEKKIFWKSTLAFFGIWVMVAAVHFPNLITASNGQELSITIFNASTSPLTLKIMAIIALIGMPVVIGYSVFVYRIFRGKVKDTGY